MLFLGFFIVALCYASAGFGGGSFYTAILTFTDLPYTTIPIVSLACNITVVSGACVLFFKNKLISIKKTLPLVAVSIPCSFIGGLIPLEKDFFYFLLGFSLFIAAVSMSIRPKSYKAFPGNDYIAFTVSGGIGLLAGMVGIGGGIYLSPILNIIHWDTPKKIAATASFYILVNSIFGIMGHVIKINPNTNDLKVVIYLLPVAVLLGGTLGSRLLLHKLNPQKIKLFTACLVLIASLRLIFKGLN